METQTVRGRNKKDYYRVLRTVFSTRTISELLSIRAAHGDAWNCADRGSFAKMPKSLNTGC